MARSNGSGLIDESCQWTPLVISAGVTMVLPGVRWNLAGTYLLSAHVLLPITDRGLVVRPIPTVSIDYLFTQ